MGCGSSVSQRAKPDPLQGTDSLVRLVYTSELVAATDAEAERHIAEILASALKNNQRRDISGMLYYDRSTKGIVQVLEGAHRAVVGLFVIIQVDKRHTGCRIIEQLAVSKRMYSDCFGMTLARTEPAKLAAMKNNGAPRALQHFGVHLMRLQYSSMMLASDADEGRRIISEILERAVSFNAANEIGGLLCFNPSTLGVVQIIEGPAPAVLALFDNITIDNRHRNLVLTSQEGAPRPLSLALYSQNRTRARTLTHALTFSLSLALARSLTHALAHSHTACSTPPHSSRPQW